VPIQPRCWYADNTQVRILEIYRDQEAYQNHIKSDHFQTYKQGTLHMVKNLELIDMDPLDPEAMPFIFKK
jgi:quinol monooxygenase YgiN